MSTNEDPSERDWRGRSRVFIAGHAGLIGAAIVRALASRGHEDLVTADRADLDLTNQTAVESFFEREQPQYVVLAAGRCVSAFEETQFPADVIRDHLTIQANVIDSAYSFGVRKLIFLATPGSVLPAALAQDPSGPPGRLLDAAKAAGLRMCLAYRRQFGFSTVAAILPTIYGRHDRFSPNRPDCVAGYMYALSRARLRGEISVTLAGDPDRSVDLLHADDVANALLWLLDDEVQEQVAFVPASSTLRLGELVNEIAALARYEGLIHFDPELSVGARAQHESSAHLRARGWRPHVSLEQGLNDTYKWFIANQQHLRL